MSDIQTLLSCLISKPSITPEDAGCQTYMMDYLQQLGFHCRTLSKGVVTNFFACYGDAGPLLVFAGHTDVVPVGDRSKWHTDPFELVEKDGMLYGRGVADMKGSLACMMRMAARFVTTYPDFPGRLGFLITSGEEGDDYDLGTPYVMEQLQANNIHIDYCIVGEPSSTQATGDVIKIGRRGSLSAKITVHGIQGHVAYPHLAENPIHQAAPALAELSATRWDEGNAHFPPTSMQITAIQSGGQASNIIPGDLRLQLNFRYSTEQNDTGLKKQVAAIFDKYGLKTEMEWRLSGKPFLTSQGKLIGCCSAAIKEYTGKDPELSTSGGTSDARFIAPYGVEVIELGPVNATIHQVNECVSLDDLISLEAIYFNICERLVSYNPINAGSR